MLKISVFLVAPTDNEESLRALHQEIVAAAASIPGLKIKGEDDLLVLFPSDRMSYGIGRELFVEIGQFGGVPWIDRDAQIRLAAALGHAVKKHYPTARVQCAISPEMWRSYESNKGAVDWSSGPAITRDEIERTQGILLRHLNIAGDKAREKCYCESNSIDHKGPCSYHFILGSYTHLMNLGLDAIAASEADFPVLADTYLAACLEEANCADFQKEMGWKT